MSRIKIVFVCLGNYCRSPMAEAIFLELAQKDNTLDYFEVSSAGTKDWDVGLHPDSRTKMILAENYYPLDPKKRAQKISNNEIAAGDYLIAMSKRIADELGNHSNVHLLMEFVDETTAVDIPDPYPTNTFPQAFNMIEKGVKAFYKKLVVEHKINI